MERVKEELKKVNEQIKVDMEEVKEKLKKHLSDIFHFTLVEEKVKGLI